MKRLVAAVVAVLGLVSPDVALMVADGESQAFASTRAGQRRAPSTDVDLTGTWIGKLPELEVAVAVISDGEIVRAYVCDGAETSAWFEGELVGNSFSMRAPDGSTITGAVGDSVVEGVFTSADAPISRPFTARQPTGGGGVFRSHFIEPDGTDTFIRWIVFDDGTQRGNAEKTPPATTSAPAAETTPPETTTPPATTPPPTTAPPTTTSPPQPTGTAAAPPTVTEPAPPLDAQVARTDGSAPVGPAAAPAPVTELTPTAIATPVPTTQLSGAPPPVVPPTAPALQPVTVAVSINPAKADVGAPIRYELTLTNPNAKDVTDAGVGVGLPPSLVPVAKTERSTCKGSFVAFPPGTTKPGQPQVVVSTVALAPRASCTAGVDISATAPTAVDVVTDAPTAAEAPPGTPARATFVFSSTVAAPASTPAPTTTTVKPVTTTTTKAPVPTTTTTQAATTTTTKAPTTTTTPPPATTSASAAPAAAASTAPSAVRNVRAVPVPIRPGERPFVGSVEFRFDPPASDGGSPITGFVAQCGGPLGGPPETLAEVEGASSPLTISNLLVGVDINCLVGATNQGGRRSPPVFVEARIPPVAPSSARNVTATPLARRPGDGPTDGRVEMSFDPPAQEGSSPVVRFEAFCGEDGRFDEREAGGASSPLTVTGLRTGVVITCEVEVINRDGFRALPGFAEPVTIASPRVPTPSEVRNVRAVPVPIRPGERPFVGSVEFRFDPPSSDGGAPITGFEAFCGGLLGGPPEDGIEVSGPSSPLTISNLLVGVDLVCGVGAVNQSDRRSPLRPIVVRIPPVAPSSARNVTATPLARRPGDGPTDGRVEMSFDPPAQEGSSPVVRFEALCGEDGRFDEREAGGASSPLTVTGLRTGVVITCEVEAINRDGFRALPGFAEPLTIASPRVPTPSEVRNVRATVLPILPGERPFAGRVEFEFDPPASDGGAPVTGFEAFCGGQLGGPEDGVEVSGPSSPLTITGLPIGVDILCGVGAVNQSDRRSPLAIVSVRVPPATPSPPRDVEARALPLRAGDGPTDGRVQVSFSPPEDDGDSDSLEFRVLCAFAGAPPEEVVEGRGTASPIVLAGFLVDVPYSCQALAENEAGPSALAFADPVTVVAPGTPSAPQGASARALPLRAGDGPDDGRVEVSFLPPADDGGGTIVDFGVDCATTATPGVIDASADAPKAPIVVTGLTVGASYRCAVTAFTDDGGVSPAAATNAVTVARTTTTTTRPPTPSAPSAPTATTTPVARLTIPGAPRDVEARPLPLRERDGAKDGRIDVGFLPPEDDGGSPLARFDAQCSTFVPPGVTDVPNNVGATATSSPVTVSGLQVDLPYTCSVTAISEAELEGPAGLTSKPVTVAGRPGPPPRVAARALPLGAAGPREGVAEVGINPPNDNGSPPITGFVARCETTLPPTRPGEVGSRLVAEGFSTDSTVTVEGLVVDFPYVCSGAAVNRIGEGQGIRATPISVNGALSGALEVQANALPLRPADGATNGRIEVSFEPPESGAPADTFAVTCVSPPVSRALGQPLEVVVNAPASPVTLEGIQVDRAYTCNVVGINQVGRGAAAFASPVVVRGFPGVPRDVAAQALPLRPGDGPDDGRAEVSFRPPADDGAPAVTSFSARCESPTTTPAGVPSSLVAVALNRRESPITVPGLRVDLPYRCHVAATNQIGEGAGALAEKTVTVTRSTAPTTTSAPPTSTTTTTLPIDAKPPGRPGTPVATALAARPGDGSSDGRITVDFAPPADDGGSPVTGFVVTCTANSTSSGTASGPKSPITVAGLPAGFRYPCFVQAENAVGLGEPSARSNLVAIEIPSSVLTPPSAPPGRPIATALAPQTGDGPSDGRITVEFAEAEKDGGSPILGYIVTCTDNANFSFVEIGPKSPITVTGIAYGFRYVCVVQAENDLAPGEASGPSNEVRLPVPPSVEQVPSRPREVVAEVVTPPTEDTADGRVAVRFTAPESDGGTPVTGYEVLCTDNAGVGATGSGAESPITVTGFAPGDYVCAVRAVNDAGPSDPSRSNTVAVRAVPAEPLLVVEPAGGASPLSTTLQLENQPEKIASWALDFGDGTPKVEGRGPVPVVPHTYLDKTDQAITLTASLTITPDGADRRVVTQRVEVQPEGTLLTISGSADPAAFRRGESGFVTLSVRNPNASRVSGPITVSVAPAPKVTFATGAWTCDATTCSIPSNLDGFAKAPALTMSVTAPADAPATLEIPVTVSASAARSETVVRVPIVGVLANAGPDQTVDATTPQPDGTLAPTRVLLDGGASLGLDGRTQRFSWRQVAGASVQLIKNIDPTERIVAFDAPAVTDRRVFEFELTVADGARESKDRVLVTVFPRNRPPVLEKIDVSGLTTKTSRTGEIVPEGRGTLQLSRVASDPDEDALTTTWRVLTNGVPNSTGSGDKFSLDWPVTSVPQVIVEATVSDPRGATDTDTVTLGVAPEPLGLAVEIPARADPGQRVNATATPSRTSGVDVQWGIVSGPTIAGFPKSGRTVAFDAPNVTATQVVTLSVTATETATGARATRQVAVQVDAPPPLVVAAPPTVSVDPGAQATIEATVTGGASPTFAWRQTFGPDVSLEGAATRTVRFRAPSVPSTIGLRLSVEAGGVTRTTDTIVTVGAAAATPPSGCGDGSAYRQLAQGGPLVLAGVAVITGGNTHGTSASCDESTFDSVDVNFLDGLVVGDNLSGTFDEDGIRFTGGNVRLPDAFRLPPIDLAGSPLRLAFPGSDDDGGAPTGGGGTSPGGGGTSPGSGGTSPGGGGTSGDACITWDVGFSSRDFPFVPLPPGFSGTGAHLAVSCTGASITADATTGGATFAVDATLADGGADATVTITDVVVLGGTASGAGSITVAPGGAPTYDLTATVDDPQLPVPGITLDTATARLTPAGLTVAAEGALGQGNGALAVSMEGSFAENGLSLAVDANNAGPWAVGPELSVDAANLVGTIDVDAAGAATLDLRLSVGGDWRPVPGLRVRQLALQVSNEGVPPECAIPAGGVWVRVSGEGAIEIPGVSPLALAVEACIGPPLAGSAPAFSLRSTVGGPQWQVADGVVIRDVGIQVTFVDDSLALQASGGATLLGLDLTARVLFLVPSGGGQPTVVVDASGSLAGLGVPITSGHVVFASAAVPDFSLEPGVELDLPQGVTGVGSIDLGQPIADLLNDVFAPPTPILPRVTVTLSFGAAIEIKAAISLGGDGATLFMGCAGGGTNCNPTAPTTTRLALDSAFIRLVLGGSGGFSIGFGGDGTLNLPPAEEGGPASPLDLHVEASIQPPARVGLALFFEGQWQNAMGLSGLNMSNLGIQGSIDFSTTPVPTVTMGITGQVDRVPTPLADLLGLTNNGEPLRFTVNVDPLAPILEMTLGVDDGGIVMRPLTGVGQPNALEVDFASVVIAPLGGTVGPVTYSPGVSAGFGANVLDVPVHLNASVDIAAAHLNGTVEVGTLTVGGVRFEDTTILLDITPTRFRQTLCGGVHVGSTTLQGLLHIQAGSGGGGPATCGGVNLDPGAGAGLRARFRINAASLPVGPVNVQQLVVDAQANLDGLSGNFDATLNATAELNVLANTLDMDGTIKFGNNTLQELHVKARGNVNVGGVEITGDGSCPFGAPGSGTGACVQLDHAPATSTPFRLGLKGKLTAAGSTATVTGTLDSSQAELSGSLAVPTLGALDVSGSLVFGGGATIRNATGATVSASPGDWRVSGQFASPTPLAGGVSAAWAFAAGRVSNGLFVRGSANTSIGGANVQLAGTFTSSGSGNLSYSLTGSANGAVSGSVVDLATTGGGTLDVLHSAIRTGVFNFPVLSPIGGRPSDERFPERMRGRLHFDTSYGLSATLTQNGLDIDEADIAARVVYGERFDRDGNGAFSEETSNQRNTLVNFDLDAGGIDEFFEMAVAGAASRTRAPTFCFGLFGNAFGDC